MKRCVDGCKYFNIRWNKKWCDKKNCEIENCGRFCNLFIADTKWGRILKQLGFKFKVKGVVMDLSILQELVASIETALTSEDI